MQLNPTGSKYIVWVEMLLMSLNVVLLIKLIMIWEKGGEGDALWCYLKEIRHKALQLNEWNTVEQNIASIHK